MNKQEEQSDGPNSEQELNPAVREEFFRFIEYHQAKRFSKNLRAMLMDFLQYDGAIEAIYLKDLLYDLEGLFELLDVIEINYKSEDDS